MHVKPECFHLSMPFPHNLQRVLDQPVCNMHIASYRPDIQFLCCTRVYFFVCAMISVAWGSVRQSHACNCSTFCTCTRSHLPHNVMHSSSNNSILVDHQPESQMAYCISTSADVGQMWYHCSLHSCHSPQTSHPNRNLSTHQHQRLIPHHQFRKQPKSGGVEGLGRRLTTTPGRWK